MGVLTSREPGHVEEWSYYLDDAVLLCLFRLFCFVENISHTLHKEEC